MGAGMIAIAMIGAGMTGVNGITIMMIIVSQR